MICLILPNISSVNSNAAIIDITKYHSDVFFSSSKDDPRVFVIHVDENSNTCTIECYDTFGGLIGKSEFPSDGQLTHFIFDYNTDILSLFFDNDIKLVRFDLQRYALHSE